MVYTGLGHGYGFCCLDTVGSMGFMVFENWLDIFDNFQCLKLEDRLNSLDF